MLLIDSIRDTYPSNLHGYKSYAISRNEKPRDYPTNCMLYVIFTKSLPDTLKTFSPTNYT